MYTPFKFFLTLAVLETICQINQLREQAIYVRDNEKELGKLLYS